MQPAQCAPWGIGQDEMAKRIGRPPKPEDDLAVLVPVRYPRPIIERADAICEKRPDQPQRSQVMREAVAIGLDVLEQRAGIKGRK
jgi:hypothetical protein